MRLGMVRSGLAVAASLAALSGCGALGLSGGSPQASASAAASPAVPWLIYVSGNPTVSAGPPAGFRPSPSPSWSPLPSASRWLAGLIASELM